MTRKSFPGVWSGMLAAVFSTGLPAADDEAGRPALIRNQLSKGLMRIEAVVGSAWELRGTGFIVDHRIRQRPDGSSEWMVMLATAAHVVEDAQGQDLLGLRFVHNSGLTFQNYRIHPHPARDYGFKRKSMIGPDVALVELKSSGEPLDDPDIREYWLLCPLQKETSLIDRAVSLYGYPGGSSSTASPRHEGNGAINSEDPDGTTMLVSYTLRTDGGMSGAPVFCTKAVNSAGTRSAETVLAVHCSELDSGIRRGTHVRHLWELVLDYNQKHPGSEVMPNVRGLEGGDGCESAQQDVALSQQIVDAMYRAVEADYNAQRFVNRSVKETAELQLDGYRDVYFEMDRVIKEVERAGNTSVPWEAYCMRGSAASQVGLKYMSIDGNKTRADVWLNAAVRDLEQSVSAGGTQIFPRLAYGKLLNNLGTPVGTTNLTETQRQYLQSTHDAVNQILEQSETAPITDLQRGQCLYLRAYTHRFLKCGSAADDLRGSLRAVNSVEAHFMLDVIEGRTSWQGRSLPHPGAVRLFEDFAIVQSLWAGRSGSSCAACNAAAARPQSR